MLEDATHDPQSYDSEDLLIAWLQAGRTDASEEDRERYAALSAAFGVDFEVPVNPDAESAWRETVLKTCRRIASNAPQQQLFPPDQQAIAELLQLFREVAGELRCPTSLVERGGSSASVISVLSTRTGIPDAVQELHARYSSLLHELARVLWLLEANPTITDDDLRRHGYEPSPTPAGRAKEASQATFRNS